MITYIGGSRARLHACLQISTYQYIYTCVCKHTCMQTYTYLHVWRHIKVAHEQDCTPALTCQHVTLHLHANIQVQMHIDTCTYINRWLWSKIAHLPLNLGVSVYVHVHANIYIHIHTYTYSYINRWLLRKIALLPSNPIMSLHIYSHANIYIHIHMYAYFYVRRWLKSKIAHLPSNLSIHEGKEYLQDQVLHSRALCCSVLQCAAVSCSVLQCLAVCCSVL